MIFKISEKKINENMATLMRKAGYFCLGRGKDEAELSFVRPLAASGYPRFHLFMRSDKGKELVFNIHLDQKKPSYRGAAAHSAEYEGPLIENEMERIKQCIL